jgi:caa(3)-type oxidase subunit IV
MNASTAAPDRDAPAASRRAQEARTAWTVYASLVTLTLLSVFSAAAGQAAGRVLVVTWALALAGAKAALIGLFFMHLLREDARILFLVGAAAAAVVVLAGGLFPDLALRLGAGG